MTDSQPDEEGGVSLEGCHLLVSWSCLFSLLSKCQRVGCADHVLPCNMDVSRMGNKNAFTGSKDINTSPAAPGALTYRLKHCTACQNGHRGLERCIPP